jgi:hypothetical protein
MAKGKYITDFERDLIRCGIAYGCNAPAIALFLGRNRMAVYNQIAAMRTAGTLQDVPLSAAASVIGRAIDGKA